MDKRVIKTKKLICSTFVELLAIKDIKNITFTDIANKADINRKTIYAHYDNVDDILDDIENSIVNAFDSVTKTFRPSVTFKDPYIVFNTLNNVLLENLDFYQKIMRVGKTSRLVVKIVSSLKNQVRQAFIDENICKEEDVDFVTSYVVYGMIGAYKYWFDSGMKVPMEEFSKYISQIVYRGITSFIEKAN